MSDLLAICERVQEVEAALSRLDRDLAAHPELPSIQLEIRSLQKRKRKLEEQFAEARDNIGVEVCSYKILPEVGNPRAADVGSSLVEYQNLVSVFYDAIKRDAPKQRARPSPESWADSKFDYGYAFAGSVGFVLLARNAPELFEESVLDASVKLVLDVAKAQRSEEILACAQKVGLGPIHALHTWAEGQAKKGFSVDIEWRKGSDVRKRVLIQKREFAHLRDTIAETSEERSEELIVTGIMRAANTAKRTFQLKPDMGPEISGESGDVINETHTVELPRRYRVRVRKTTRIRYSTDKEDVLYRLLEMEPV